MSQDVMPSSSGGLLSRGHPPGATGLAQVSELVRQLRGSARTADGQQERAVAELREIEADYVLYGIVDPDPANALSDGPNAWPLQRMAGLLTTLKQIDDTVKANTLDELSLTGNNCLF